MAKIEFECEVSMDELRGLRCAFYDGKKNAYTTDKLTDDEFNFISGMNYAVNHFILNLIDNLDEIDELYDNIDMLYELKKKIAETVLSAAKNSINREISYLITEFIDHDD